MLRQLIPWCAAALLVSGCATAAPPPFRAPTAVSGLVSTLDAGTEPATLWLLGDSTGNGTDEWFCQTVGWLTERYPTYSVVNLSWSPEREAWESLYSTAATGGCVDTVGAAGDRSMATSLGAYARLDDAPALRVGGDLEVLARVEPQRWDAGPVQTVAGKTGGPGDRGWRLLLEDGRPAVEWSVDGVTSTRSTATAPVPFLSGRPGWIRFTLDADADGSAVRFAVSENGLEWSDLGRRVPGPAAAGTFPTRADLGVGALPDGADPLVGKLFYVEVRAGAGGPPVAIVDLGLATGGAPRFRDLLGNDVTLIGSPPLAGAPVLAVYNASVPGQTAMYPLERDRLTSLTPVPADVAFLNFGHNHGTALTMRIPYRSLTDAIEARWPEARLVVVTQNPQTAPRTAEQVAAQEARMTDLVAWTKTNRFGLVDAYTPMAAAPQGMVAQDGIHPSAAGVRLWQDIAVGLFLRPADAGPG